MVALEFYEANITGNTDSDWKRAVPPPGHVIGGWFFIDGTAGDATYTLMWRPPASTDNGMVIAQYETLNKTTAVMLQINITDGEMKCLVASGSAINSRPKFIWGMSK